MIFAAGFGTRMGRLTEERPKALLEVGGRTLLDRTIDLATSAGLERLIVNTHYLGAMIKSHLEGREVKISDETGKVLETGGGLKAAAPLVRREFVYTANPDVVWLGPNPFSFLRDTWTNLDADGADALLLVIPVERAIGRMEGDFRFHQGHRLSRGGPLVFTGAQIIRVGPVLEEQAEVFSLNRVWDRLLSRGTVLAAVYPGDWCDVGTPQGLERAERMLDTNAIND